MKTKTSQLVIRINSSHKEALRQLANDAGLSMANYIVAKLELDKKTA